MPRMRRWLAVAAGVAVAMVVVTGCKYGAQAFVCANKEECGPGGTCQPDSFCSFDDSTCPSGQRYGDISGDKSGQCVGAQPGKDAGVDVPPDMLACYGTGLLRICFASPPGGSRTISMATPIDTMTSDLCVATAGGGSNYCVIAASMLTIDLKLRATGAKPLVLLASDTITANATIDVGSHRGVTPETGAGADPTACAAGTLPGTAGSTGGGGAGGSFLSLGGHGGTGGGGSGNSAGGTPGAAVSTVAELRGGCAGQDGDGPEKGLKGHGGGAVFLIAGNKIDVKAGINAAGEGGTGGGGSISGAGGGGAGGMIGFDAPMIMSAGMLLATGGGGGEGGDTAAGTAGAPGADPTTTAPALGGNGNNPRGGDGGNGSSASGTAGGNGNPGDTTGANRGGGGGGGGGAGIIKAPATASLGTQVAPAATP